MSAFRRSNALVEHALGEKQTTPTRGETWRLRKGNRSIVIDEVGTDTIAAHEPQTGRRTMLRRDTLIARYVKVDPPSPPI